MSKNIDYKNYLQRSSNNKLLKLLASMAVKDESIQTRINFFILVHACDLYRDICDYEFFDEYGLSDRTLDSHFDG